MHRKCLGEPIYFSAYGRFKGIVMRRVFFCFALLLSTEVLADRIKDLANVAGVRTNRLIG